MVKIKITWERWLRRKNTSVQWHNGMFIGRVCCTCVSTHCVVSWLVVEKGKKMGEKGRQRRNKRGGEGGKEEGVMETHASDFLQ